MSEHTTLKRQIYGTDSHVHLLHALEGVTPEQAGAVLDGASHSIYQLVMHMTYWQDIGLARMRGEPAPSPEHAAEGWAAPAAPGSDDDWSEAVEGLAAGLWELEATLESGEIDLDRVVEPDRSRTVRDNVLMVLCHNSYHLGEIVILRRQLGAWPPPKGGTDW
jgi:uncharacterized damage-inducible protein DinB